MKTTRFFYVMFIMSLFFISCSENSIPDNTIVENNKKPISLKPIKQGQVDISLADAQTIAQLHMKKQFQKNITPREASSRSENNMIVSQTGKELAHIVNFQEGGYCIISANKKNIPILAYSDHGYFSNTENILGLEIWKKEIEIQFNNYEKLSESEITWINRQWMEYEESETRHDSRSNPDMNAAFNQEMALYNPSTGRTAYPLNIAQNYLPAERYQHFKSIASSKNSPEEYTIIEIVNNSVDESVGPLLTTQWHQGSPFNDKINIDDAGCVPIAVAQIMNFHQYPLSDEYDWTNMTDDNIMQNDDAATLIKKIRDAIGMGNSPTITDSDDIVDALENDFNYSAEKREHEISRLYSYVLDLEVPVLLLGSDSYSILGGYQDGHAWVCDGASYEEERYAYRINWITMKNGEYVYETDGIDYNNWGTPFIEFHYNWGWENGLANGWYIGNNVKPNNIDYDFKVGRNDIFMYPNN